VSTGAPTTRRPREKEVTRVPTPVLIDLVVGEAVAGSGAVRQPVSLAEADAITAVAQEVGVTALRLLDGGGVRAIDPTIVSAYLAGNHADIGYLADVPTTHNAPYNLARRVLSVDRATGGRAGVVLRVGGGDDVSAATTPDPSAADPAQRWTEYAQVLNQLWTSFPRAALLGDQERALVVDDTLIRPIAHEGRFYRVAGPLDGPSSPQGRPVLVAVDLDVLDWSAIAASVDVVIVGRNRAAGADLALTAALERVGRSRPDVGLIGRTAVAPADDNRFSGGDLAVWAVENGLDGVDLVPSGDADQINSLLRSLVPELRPPRAGTLRAGLGLREPVEVPV